MAPVLKPFHPHVFLIGHGDMGSRIAKDLIDTKVRSQLYISNRKLLLTALICSLLFPGSSPSVCGLSSGSNSFSKCATFWVRTDVWFDFKVMIRSPVCV